jgi:TRAP-type C4-dicarboxylate transport system substrate-binding protein
MSTLRIGGYQPEISVHTRSLRHFASALHGRLGAALHLEIVPDVTDQRLRAADLPTMVEAGELDACYFASSYLAGRVASLGLLDVPFPATDREEIYRKLDGNLGARLAADVAACTGCRVLGFWDNGFRHISNRLRPIRHPDDCRGMRLRTLDNALHREIFAALGFEPIFVDVKDLADAVARYAVDAQENPLTNLVNFGLYRTHRHVSLTSHFFGVALFLMNRGRLDALSSEIQLAVRAAAAEATQRQRELAAAEDARCLAVLGDDGVQVVAPEEIDLPAFSARVATIVERERKQLGGTLW